MATTEEYKNGGSASYTFSIEKIKDQDIKVAVDGTDLTYTATNPPAQTTEYTVNGSNVIFKQASVSGSTAGGVRIYRETALENSDSATFVAGSSIRAADLNANHKLVRFSAQEKNQEITTADIRNSAVTSAKILDGTIVEADIANLAITSNKIANDAVTTTEILNGAVTRAKLEADIIDGTKIEDNAVDSEHYTDGSIDRVHLETDIIDSTKLADNAVNSEHYVDGSIDHVHLANDIIDGDNIQDDAVDSEHITAGALDNEHYATGSITSDKLNGATVVTNSEQSGYSVNDTSFFTTSAAEARYFNASTGETIKDGDAFPDNDTTIATTAAINDRILDILDSTGGFVPLVNETFIPYYHPEVENTDVAKRVGTIISIGVISKTGGYTTANGRRSGTTVTISASDLTNHSNNALITDCSVDLPEGFGVLVETTAQNNTQYLTNPTFKFHRLVPKATEVTTVAANTTQIGTVHTNITQVQTVHNNITDIVAVANDATDIGAVAAKATEIGRLGTADAVADMAILGTADVVSDLNTLGTADVVSDMNTLATADIVADMNMLAVSDVISDMNALATSGNITAMDTCSTNIASINNASSNISSVNNFGDTYQVHSNNPTTDGGGNALAAGDLYFDTSANQLKVYNGSSWQGGVTASGSFATVTGNTFTGDNRYNDGVKALFGTGSDLQIYHNGNSEILSTDGFLRLRNQVSSGVLYLQSAIIQMQPSGGGELIFDGRADGSVSLYYDNSKKLETTSTGAFVTGRLDIGNSSWSYPKPLNVQGSSGAILALRNNDTTSYAADTNTAIEFSLNTGNTGNQSGSCEIRAVKTNGTNGNNARHLSFYTGVNGGSPTERLRIESGGDIKVTGDKGLYLGANNDLMVAHDGTSTRIEDSYGYMNIKSNILELKSHTDSEKYATFTRNGAAELYYDNSKKFQTYSSGIQNLQDVWFDSDTTAGRDAFWDSSASLLRFYDSAKATFGNGDDLQIYHDGTNSILHNLTGQTWIQGSELYLSSNHADGQEKYLKAVANGAVELYHDNSKKLETTSTGATVTGNLTSTKLLSSQSAGSAGLGFGDNVQIHLGDSDDLQLFHTGSGSVIQNGASSGQLTISSDNALNLCSRTGTEYFFRAYTNGAAELYHDNSKKFETASTGTLTTGQSKVDVNTSLNGNTDYNGQNFGLLVSYDGGDNNNDEGNGICFSQLYTASDTATIRTGAIVGYKATASGNFGGGLKLKVQQNGASTLNTALQIDSGSSVLMPNDNSRLKIGASQDLQIFHSGGSHSEISDTTGHQLYIKADNALYLQSNTGSENYIRCLQNGAVELYYNNSKKFETTGAGVTISGGTVANGHITLPDHTGSQDGKLRFGAGTDLEIYHNGNHSFLHNSTGDFVFEGDSIDFYNAAGNELHMKLEANAGVELYHDNNKKLETTASGATVTGTCTATAFSGDGSGLTGISAIPAGMVAPFAQTSTPSGWLACNGNAVSRSTYSALFAAIGTVYGAGDGSSTFNVPELRGEFIRGLDNSRGIDSGRANGSFQDHGIPAMKGNIADNHGQARRSTFATSGFTNVFTGVGTSIWRTLISQASGSFAYVEFDSTNVIPDATHVRPRNVAMTYMIKT